MNRIVTVLATALAPLAIVALAGSIGYLAYRALTGCTNCQAVLVARDDQALLALDEELRIDVLRNDSGRGALSIDWVGPPTRGAVTIVADRIVYRPSVPCGLDTFRYRVKDEQLAMDEAQVVIAAMPLDESFVELKGLEPFVFDRAELTDKGRCLIQRLAERLSATSPRGMEKIWFTGHTCAIGPEQRNNELAKARAQVARDYLLRVLEDLKASEWTTRVTDATGEGSKKPRPETAHCNRRKQDRATFEKCLAPNRRVVLEVR